MESSNSHGNHLLKITPYIHKSVNTIKSLGYKRYNLGLVTLYLSLFLSHLTTFFPREFTILTQTFSSFLQFFFIYYLFISRLYPRGFYFFQNT